RCRFSALRRTGRPASRDSVSDGKTGVTRATPSSRSRARSISGSPGAASVAIVDPEDLLEYLAHRGQRVELTRLHLGEEPPQLGVVRDRTLEVAARAARRDREHLPREVRPAPRLELPALLEERAVLRDLLPQLAHVPAADRLGETTEVAARPHRPDENLGVEEVVAQPDAVAEQSPVRERARRIDRDHADRDAALPHVPDQRRDEARLADSGRAGDADRVGGA